MDESTIVQNEETQPVQSVRFSAERNDLFGALAKARKAFGRIVKSSENPFFKSKYADLSEILDATTDGLSDNGLAVMQFPTVEDGRVVIVTILGHSSGQWAEGKLPMPVTKNDAQGVGSSITYGRRYAFGALVSVASELDDDGNAAVGKKNTSDRIEQAQDSFAERSGEPSRASNALVDAFRATFEKSGKTEAQLLAVLQTRYSASRPSELTPKELGELVKWVSSSEPLQATLETSVEAAKKPLERTLDSSVSQTGKGISEKQVGRLFAIAKSHNKPEGDIRQYVKESYGLEHLKDMTPLQYNHVCKWAEDV